MAQIKATELLKLIPDEILEKIGKDTEVDKVNQQLTGKTIFNALLLSLSQTTRMSLRYLENVYNSAQFQQFNEKKSTKKAKGRHSSFADRLSKINVDYFAEIFNHLVDDYHAKMPKTIYNQIYRFDATLMKISSKLFKGINCGGSNRKKGTNFAKIVVGQKGLISSSVYFCEDKTEAGDDIALANAIKEATLTADDIIVFDRGIQSLKTFSNFTNSDVMFVTRVKLNRKYEILETNFTQATSQIGSILSDQNVMLWKDKRYFQVPFRLIKVMGEQNEVFILTNIFTLTAEEIAEIYKRRWDIEVLFRFIKQELNLKHFLARNPNGFKVYMYMILIMSILLLMYKTQNSLTGYKFVKMDFFRDIENSLICELITISGGNPQIFLERFGLL